MEKTEFDFNRDELSSDVLTYLEPGEQTEITPEIENHVKDVVSRLQGNTIQKAQQILGLMEAHSTQHDFTEDKFRQRTAADIMKSRYYTGCTDFALVFTLLARSAGIPTIYVETISEESLNSENKSYSGHVYTKIYDFEKKDWIWVDPMQREVPSTAPNKPTPEQENSRGKRIVLAEGKDSWDIGIHDFNSLKETFDTFKKDWREKHKNI